MDDNNNINQSAEPNVNQPKMFTQAEKDKEIAMIINREREKVSDYDDIKTKVETLEAEKKERSLADASDLEKANIQIEELTRTNVSLTGQVSEFAKHKTRNLVLGDAKYNALPRVYKDSVLLSDSTEDVQQSAEKILSEYQADTGKKIESTFGIPPKQDTTISTPDTVIKNPEGLASALKDRVQSIIKNSGRG